MTTHPTGGASGAPDTRRPELVGGPRVWCTNREAHEPHWHTIRAAGITYAGGWCYGEGARGGEAVTPEQAKATVGGHAVARTVQGGEFGRGFVVSYSIVPTLTIEREDGSRFSWRHDLCESLADTLADRTTEEG